MKLVLQRQTCLTGQGIEDDVINVISQACSRVRVHKTEMDGRTMHKIKAAAKYFVHDAGKMQNAIIISIQDGIEVVHLHDVCDTEFLSISQTKK